MSVFKEIKRDFIYDLARSQYTTWNFGQYSDLAGRIIPEKTLDRWVASFYKKQECFLNDKPRVVNHFKLGADPEFVFMQDGEIVHANLLGLKAGLCVGADNNGRLAELRPKPSKSALHVVASLYAELCFIAQWNPGLIKYTWYASPFAGKDGLGGHIHFGRWSNKLKQDIEVNALDKVMTLMIGVGLVETKLQQYRLKTGLYGKFRDIRPQMHGYEYRTFPSWLGCPRQTHLYLTLAKLAVHMPQMFGLITPTWTIGQSRNFINNVLSFFQNLDDDARIAKNYFEYCLLPPVGNIQKAWNIQPVFRDVAKRKDEILPPIIAPNETHLKIIFEYLTKGIFPINKPVVFEPLMFPKGYEPFQHVTNTERQPDLGELVWDLALIPIGVSLESVNSHSRGDATLHLSPVLYELVKAKLKETKITLPDGTHLKITNSIGTTNAAISFPSFVLKRLYSGWLKKYLVESGVFPFVRLGQVGNPDEWKINVKERLLLRA